MFVLTAPRLDRSDSICYKSSEKGSTGFEKNMSVFLVHSRGCTDTWDMPVICMSFFVSFATIGHHSGVILTHRGTCSGVVEAEDKMRNSAPVWCGFPIRAI